MYTSMCTCAYKGIFYLTTHVHMYIAHVLRYVLFPQC